MTAVMEKYCFDTVDAFFYVQQLNFLFVANKTIQM